MKKKSELFGIICLITLFFIASGAEALPTLQLDIAGGWYDTKTETVMSPGKNFTLYAYLNPKDLAALGETYFVSMALVPMTGPAEGDFGSFVFDGQTYNVTENMVYGVPPLETVISSDPGDLASHGIYETFFAQREFKFTERQWVYQYNTQNQRWPAPDTGKDIMYYQAFSVDTSGLKAGYSIHFDLYNSNIPFDLYNSIMAQIANNKISSDLLLVDVDASLFAPFSHDAESTTEKVPEPGTLLYLGFALGLVGAAGYGRKINLL